MQLGRFAIALGVTALLLQACAREPSGPPARIFAADMAGAAKTCTVPPVTAESGRTVDVAMKVRNDGGWCAVTVNNGGRPYDAGLLTAQASRGKVLVHTVGNDTRIDYTPAARFAGTDTFSVRLIPGDAVLRVAVTVTP